MRKLRTIWKSTPGNLDPNHLLDPLFSDNHYGIPTIDGQSTPLSIDWSLTFDAYRSVVRKHLALPAGRGLVTFFTADYRFEQLWTSPSRFLGYMTPKHVSLTPDFSLYTDHPRAVHLWNIFRSRWLGAYWQRSGLQIVPTVTWADLKSYDYCFLGLPSEAVLAVSTVGVLRRKATVLLWAQGYAEMVRRLRPVQVICSGAIPLGFTSSVPLLQLQPFTSRFNTQRAPFRAGSRSPVIQ